MQAKLLLLQPPIQDFYDTDIRLQPIGLAYLKAALKKHLPEISVKILDFHHGWGRRTLPIPSELAYLQGYYPYPDESPFCGFHQYYHFGAPFESIAACVAAERPDWIGISNLFSPYYREVLAMAAAIKAKLPHTPILVGGSHVSAVPESMLASPHVDYIIRGEGERPLVEFLRNWPRLGSDEAVARSIPNLGYKRGGELILNPLGENYRLDDLPAPDLSDFSLDTYRFQGKPLSFLITSRSCPHRCSFCSVHQTFGLNYRRSSVDKVFGEIEDRYAQGYRVLDFEDDNLTFYQEEMTELCERLIARFAPGKLQLLAMNGISYLSLSPKLLALMRQAGFTHLNLALVSSERSIRESTKRPHTLQKYLEVVEAAYGLGFHIVSYQILGLPQESLASMIQTLACTAELPILAGASLFYLTPNSPIARELGAMPTPENMFGARLTAMANRYSQVEREDLYTLFILTRIVDFLKSWDLPTGASLGLEAILQSQEKPKRVQIGIDLLNRLFHERKLYAATPWGLKELTRFKWETFAQAWGSLRFIRTQRGGRIELALQDWRIRGLNLPRDHHSYA